MFRWLVSAMGGDVLLQEQVAKLEQELKEPPVEAQNPEPKTAPVIHYPGGTRLATPDVRHSPTIEEHFREATKHWKSYGKSHE